MGDSPNRIHSVGMCPSVMRKGTNGHFIMIGLNTLHNGSPRCCKDTFLRNALGKTLTYHSVGNIPNPP